MNKHTSSRLILIAAILLSLIMNRSAMQVSQAAPAQQPVLPASLGEVEATWNLATNTPSFLRGHMPLPISAQSAQADVASAVLAFIDQYRALFGITSVQNELIVVQSQVDELGMHHVTLQQVYQGVKVHNALMKVHMNLAHGEVIAASSGFVPGVALPGVQPQTSAEAATQFARSLLPAGMLQIEPQLVVFAGYGGSRAAVLPQLAWLVELYDESAPARNIYVVDALDGELLDIIEQIHTGEWPTLEQEPEPDDVTPAGVQSPDEVEIVGGEEADPQNYHWMAALVRANRTSDASGQFCGGTLIYPRWILTAGHCVVDPTTGKEDESEIEVVLGWHKLLQPQPDSTPQPVPTPIPPGRLGDESIGVSEIIPHPQFAYIDIRNTPSVADDDLGIYDVALLHLSEASSQETLPFFASRTDAPLFAPDAAPAVALGWGLTGIGDTEKLLQVKLSIFPTQVCAPNDNSFMEQTICVGYEQGGKVACSGDSGGPLIVQTTSDNMWLQVGVASFSDARCANPNEYSNAQYSGYAKVSEFHDWVVSTLTSICNNVTEIPQIECQSLMLLYHSTDGLGWTTHNNWGSSPTPCSWHGVTCTDGHVTQLNLESHHLSGALPPELTDLTYLESLDLDNNQLRGVIPAELSKLTGLKTLSLFGNQLSGKIPGALGSLVNLELLDLSTNQITGVIHSALGHLTQLKTLLLYGNNLNGNIPAELGNLTNLGWLDLSANQLSGEIPVELGRLANLVTLNLSQNKLNGRIPVELSNLARLQNLYLGENQLQGGIPPELGNPPALDRLFLHSNQLRGPLPQNLTKLTLAAFWYGNTRICEPQDNAIQAWLATIPDLNQTGVNCAIVGQAKRYSTYSAEHGTQLPGTLMRVDDEPAVGDLDADHAHEFAVSVHLYYTTTHQRNSYDNQGALVISTAHYGRNYNNAFWNGKQMVYGDGFPVNDVVAHELTHAVTQYSANLEYRWQSGALNESFSDIFAAMVDREDWLIGEDLPPDALGGRGAIRDMADPARLGQPAHTKDWVNTCADDEGVHTNSGIFNKAFYNIATASAVGKDKAEKIFYRALTIYLQPTSSFEDARAKVLQSTEDLYGRSSSEYAAVVSGFDAVGIDGRWNPPNNGDCDSCAATVAMANETDGEGLLTTLRAVRDQVFTQDPGRRWARIYYDHQFEVAWRLISNSQVRVDATAGFKAFDPVFRALLGETDEPVILTPELIAAAERALMSVANSSSAAIHDDIVREWERVNPSRFVGWDVRNVWEQLRREEQADRIHLPIIQN